MFRITWLDFKSTVKGILRIMWLEIRKYAKGTLRILWLEILQTLGQKKAGLIVIDLLIFSCGKFCHNLYYLRTATITNTKNITNSTGVIRIN